MTDRLLITARDVPAPIGPYSHAVAHAGLLYCTGQLPLDQATGELTGATAGEQAALCLDGLAAVCRAAGTDLVRALRVGIYLTDLATFAEVNEAYRERFAAGPPARTTIGVAALPMGARVEMDAVVALDRPS